MINQAERGCSVFGDIFSIREKVINDILLQNNLDKIRQRQVERTSSANKKPKRKSKLKNKKVSELILPQINFTSNLNTNQFINRNKTPNNNNHNNNSNQNNTLNTEPNRNLLAQIKNNISNSKSNLGGLFLTNVNQSSNNNPFQSQSNMHNLILNTNSNNNPSINPIHTSENTNSIKPTSVASESNQFKFLFSYDDSNRESFLKRFLESKKRKNLKKLLEIEKENEFFIKRLKSVNSNLSRDKLNSAYALACEYKKIAKKTKTNKELKERIDNKVIAHLPPIILNRFSSLSKVDLSLSSSRVVSNTYEG